MQFQKKKKLGVPAEPLGDTVYSPPVGEEYVKPEEVKDLFKPRRFSKAFKFLLIALLGFLAGFGGFYAYLKAKNNTQTKQETASQNNNNAPVTASPAATSQEITKAVDFRVTLTSTYKQHVSLTTTAVRSAIDAKGDLQALKTSIEKNSGVLAQNIGEIYGTDAQNKFTDLWKKHVEYMLTYALASKKNNSIERAQANASLQSFTIGMSELFTSLNPDIDKANMKALLDTYVADLKGVIDNYIPCDFAKSIQMQEETYKVVAQISDVLTDKTVKLFPQKFG